MLPMQRQLLCACTAGVMPHLQEALAGIEKEASGQSLHSAVVESEYLPAEEGARTKCLPGPQRTRWNKLR